MAQSARTGALNGYFPGCALETYKSKGLGREDGEYEVPQPLQTAGSAWLAEGAHGKARQNWANGAARIARKQLESGGSQYPAYPSGEGALQEHYAVDIVRQRHPDRMGRALVLAVAPGSPPVGVWVDDGTLADLGDIPRTWHLSPGGVPPGIPPAKAAEVRSADRSGHEAETGA